MIGILTEAFLFEFMLMLWGRNIVGTLAGGSITALSAIIHKFFTLLILYGFDFVRILDSLYRYAVKQLHIETIKPTDLIGLLAALYLIIGLLVALIGYFVGNNFRKKEIQDPYPEPIRYRNENKLFGMSEKQNFSSYLILVHIAFLIVALWLLDLNYTLGSLTISFFYIGFCLYRYPSAINRLKKPSVWIQFSLIVFASVLIWDVLQIRIPGVENGWITGIKMIFRAILLIIGFAAISVELKNPLVKTVLYKRGLSKLYQSLNLAFGVLPDLVASLSKSKLSILNPISLTNQLLQTSQNLITVFKEEQDNLPTIFILTDDVGRGKTTYAKNLISILRNQGFRPGGFLSFGIDEPNGRAGFNLIDIDTSDSIILCKTTFKKEWAQTGRYYFNPEAVEFGENSLNPDHLTGTDLIIIDEIGPLELTNQGWSHGIEQLCSSHPSPQLWVVRKKLVKQICRKWTVGDVYIFDLQQDTGDTIVKFILNFLQQKNRSKDQISK